MVGIDVYLFNIYMLQTVAVSLREQKRRDAAWAAAKSEQRKRMADLQVLEQQREHVQVFLTSYMLAWKRFQKYIARTIAWDTSKHLCMCPLTQKQKSALSKEYDFCTWVMEKCHLIKTMREVLVGDAEVHTYPLRGYIYTNNFYTNKWAYATLKLVVIANVQIVFDNCF